MHRYVRELLHTKQRRDDTCEHLTSVLGEYCISCEIQLAGPEYGNLQGFSSLPPEVAEELLNSKLSDEETCSKATRPDPSTRKRVSITVDNTLSPAHTLLQIQCIDQKCLAYDIMRASKDCNVQVI